MSLTQPPCSKRAGIGGRGGGGGGGGQEENFGAVIPPISWAASSVGRKILMFPFCF